MTSIAQGSAGHELLVRAAQREVAALSQLITAVEARTTVGMSVLDEIYSQGGKAQVVGVTGAPGSGKSTLVGALARHLRTRDLRVAVVAVDPSSSISGGAILGDRIRMSEHVLDPGIFVRSMSSRGILGGLARATGDVVAVLDASGWDVVLVETVGVGQGEVEVAQLAHTTVVVSVPGLGDDIQVIKAGLLEVADIHVVNKVDRPDANRTIAELTTMLKLGVNPQDAWQIPVIGTSAKTGEGVEDLVEALTSHRYWYVREGRSHGIDRTAATARLVAVLKEIAVERVRALAGDEAFETLVSEVVRRELHPGAAATRLLELISGQNDRKDAHL